MAKKWPENEQKFKELVLYVCDRCDRDPRFGTTKLYKILYFSDFLAYAQLKQPITGFEYQRLPNGPAPRRFLPIQEQMQKTGEIALRVVTLKSGLKQKRFSNLRPPNLDVFSAAEISLVDAVISELWDLDAEAVSELSHRMAGWQLAEPNETIPYESVFISMAPLSEVDLVRARELIKSGRLVHE